jgi:Flp pilus assembly pilin Flp
MAWILLSPTSRASNYPRTQDKQKRKEVSRMNLLKRLVKEEEGQNIVEYTLMIGLVVLVIWAAVSALGIDTAVNTVWNNVKNSLTTAAS